MVNRNRRSIPNHVDAINTPQRYILGPERLAALNSFGEAVVEALAAGDGLPAGDGLSPDGEGLPAADGELPAGEGESAGDGELPAGDGLLSDGDGLSAAVHTLSAVAEPALLSISVVALHAVQLVQVFWFVAVENCPLGHASQVRSVVAVPLAAIFWPAMQVVQPVQENALALVLELRGRGFCCKELDLRKLHGGLCESY